MDDTGGALSRRVSETALVLQHDRELGDTVQAEQREAAARASAARVLRVGSGRWDACAAAGPARGGHGLLVLAGLLVRQVGLNERVAAELLGPGDLLRPLEHDGEEATLPFEATWRVLTDVRIAILDLRWAYRMAPFPEVAIALTGRAMRRARRIANTIVIAQQTRL